MSLESKRKSPPVSITAESLIVTRSEWGTTRTVVNHLEMFLDGGTFHVVSPIQIETLSYVEIAEFIYMHERSLVDIERNDLPMKMVKHSESPNLRTSSKAFRIQ